MADATLSMGQHLPRPHLRPHVPPAEGALLPIRRCARRSPWPSTARRVKDVLGPCSLTSPDPPIPWLPGGETAGALTLKALRRPSPVRYGSVDKLPKITATFSDTPRNRLRYEWMVAKWKEVLGIEVELNPVEATTYTALTKDITTAPQMYVLGWCADYPDPQNWLSVYWKTGGFGQRIAYSNPDFDALVNEADTTTDPAKRSDLYAQAQDLLVEGAPVAFFWNNVNTYLIKPWVKGIVLTPQDAGWAGNVSPLTIDIDTTMLP